MTLALSLQQEARLASHRSRPAPPLALLYRFPPRTEVTCLLRAVELVGAATEAWCRRFDLAAGQARAVDGTEAVDADDLGAVESPGAVKAALDAPHDPASGPLARARAGRTPGGEVLLGLAVDRLAWDCRSTSLSTQQIAGAYERLASGDADPPVDTGAPYSSFVAWQRRQLEGDWGDRARRFWAAKFAQHGAYPPVLAAPDPLGAPAGGPVAVEAFLGPAVAARVQAGARRLRVSRHAYLLAAILATLRKLDPDLGGVLVDASGRLTTEVATTVGLFSHSLPVWDPDGGPVESAAVRVHADVGQALVHAAPLGPLLATVGHEPEAGRGVLPFVVFEDAAMVPASSFAAAGGELVERPEALGPSDLLGDVLLLRLRERGGGLDVRLEAGAAQLDEEDGRLLLDLLEHQL